MESWSEHFQGLLLESSVKFQLNGIAAMHTKSVDGTVVEERHAANNKSC